MTHKKSRPLVSLVIPAFNEENNLPELYDRLEKIVAPLTDFEFEFLVIDNHSQDTTEQLARSFTAKDSRYRYIKFSRNFGFEASLFAGIHYARGDALIYLTSDLQDPPEYIPVMLEKWQEGYDIVYGKVKNRHDVSILKTLGAKIAYRLIYSWSDIKIPENATDFRLISRPTIEALKRCGEHNRYLRGLVHWVGFKQTSFEYDRAPRSGGVSTAGLIFSLNFAITALVAFSTKPLRWASLLGIATTLISILGVIGYLILVVLVKFNMVNLIPPPPGWTTQTFLMFFFGGIQCLFLGIIGEYLSRVYGEVKNRPNWVIQHTAGFPEGQDPLALTLPAERE